MMNKDPRPLLAGQAAGYGNAKILSLVLDQTNNFDGNQDILGHCFKKFLYGYKSHITSPTLEKNLIEDWLTFVPYVLSQTEDIVRDDCGNYKAILDQFVELGLRPNEETIERLWDVPDDDEIKMRLVELCNEDPDKPLLLVCQFSWEDVFTTDHGTLSQEMNDTNRMHVFYASMQTIAQDHGCEVDEFQNDSVLISGPVDKLQTISDTLSDKSTCLILPKSLIEQTNEEYDRLHKAPQARFNG